MSSDVTRILSAIEQGDPKAAEQLLPLIAELQMDGIIVDILTAM